VGGFRRVREKMKRRGGWGRLSYYIYSARSTKIDVHTWYHTPRNNFARYQRTSQAQESVFASQKSGQWASTSICRLWSTRVYLDVAQGQDSAWPLLLSSPDQIGQVKAKSGRQFPRLKPDIRSGDYGKVEHRVAVPVTDVFSVLVWRDALSHTAEHKMHFADVC
jgi:hypothetical protein